MNVKQSYPCVHSGNELKKELNHVNGLLLDLQSCGYNMDEGENALSNTTALWSETMQSAGLNSSLLTAGWQSRHAAEDCSCWHGREVGKFFGFGSSCGLCLKSLFCASVFFFIRPRSLQPESSEQSWVPLCERSESDPALLIFLSCQLQHDAIARGAAWMWAGPESFELKIPVFVAAYNVQHGLNTWPNQNLEAIAVMATQFGEERAKLLYAHSKFVHDQSWHSWPCIVCPFAPLVLSSCLSSLRRYCWWPVCPS